VNDDELLASVVVAVRGDERRLRRLLGRLLRQTAPHHLYEVIVVENGTKALADVDGMDGVVRYLHAEEPNSAAARNLGLQAARGRYLLMTDADCVAERDWIEKMIQRLDAGFVMVGGIIGKYNPRTWVQRHAITVVDGQTRLNYLPALHLPYVVGANAGFVTAELRMVGGFDEELRSGNDVDVCYRLGLRGHSIGLAHNAVIWHEDRATVAGHFRRFRFYAVYQVLLFAKYRHASGKTFVFDSYPFRRAGGALAALPGAAVKMLRGDTGPMARAFLQTVEAAGVLVGELEGAVRYRQFYV